MMDSDEKITDSVLFPQEREQLIPVTSSGVVKDCFGDLPHTSPNCEVTYVQMAMAGFSILLGVDEVHYEKVLCHQLSWCVPVTVCCTHFPSVSGFLSIGTLLTSPADVASLSECCDMFSQWYTLVLWRCRHSLASLVTGFLTPGFQVQPDSHVHRVSRQCVTRKADVTMGLR